METPTGEVGAKFAALNQTLRNRANASYEAFMGDYSMGSIERAREAVDVAKREMEEFLTETIGWEVKLGNRTR